MLVWSVQRGGALSCRHVDQAGGGMKRHGIPVMSATRCGGNKDRLQAVIRGWRFDRPSVPGIDSAGPGDTPDELLRGKELAGLAIEHVEKSVLRRLHDDLACCAADLQIREH